MARSWPKLKFQEIFDEYIDSKLFKDSKKLFNLSSISFTIGNESHKQELIDFLIRTYVDMKTTFTVLERQYGDYLRPIQDLITQTIDSGTSIIALYNNKIVAHESFSDLKATHNSTKSYSHYSVLYKYGAELIEHAKRLFFKTYQIDIKNIEFGEYSHPGWVGVDSKYKNTGLAIIMMSFPAVLSNKLGYKYFFGTSTTSRTRRTPARNKFWITMFITDYDYSQHVFQDGKQMSYYIEAYGVKYNVEKEKLIENCVVQVMRETVSKDFNIIEKMIEMWWHKVKKHKMSKL
eukprot:130322_1